MRNTRWALAAGASTVLALLSGCGAVTGLIPDQRLNDPLRLNNVSMTATVGGTRVVATAVKLSGPYPNLSSVPVVPRGLRLDQPIRPRVRVRTASGEMPPSVTLRDISLQLTVIDADGRTLDLPVAVIAGPITATHVDGTLDYDFPVGEYVLSQVMGDKKDALLAILTGGGENTVRGTLSLDVTSSPTLPDGSTLGILFLEGSGTATF